MGNIELLFKLSSRLKNKQRKRAGASAQIREIREGPAQHFPADH